MGWLQVELDKAADIRGGATPRRDNASYWNGDVPWVTPTDLPATGSGIVDILQSTQAITREGLNASSASLLPPGTVLFSSRATIGKIGIAAVPLTTNQGFANLIPRSGVDSRYLAWCLHFHADRIAGLAGSTTFKEVSKSSLKRFRIPLPPPSEQRRIVEILDQADHLGRLRTEADGKANRILSAFVEQILGSPTGWSSDPRSRVLGDLVDFVSGGTPSKGTSDYWSGAVPWVSPKDMKRNFLVDSEDHISRLAVGETNLKMVQPGSVLIVVRGMILARDVPVALNLVPVTINQDMKALAPKDQDVTGSFIWAALNLARASLRSFARTAAHGTRKLDTPELMQFPVVVPSPAEIARVDAAVGQNQQLIARRENSKAKLDGLFSILMSRAFDGSLTADWRKLHMKQLLLEIEQQARTLATVGAPG